jgi:hypothetical protein
VSCDVAFDETVSYPRDVFECTCNKKIEEIIFIDEKLQSFNYDKDEPLFPSTSSLEFVYVTRK